MANRNAEFYFQDIIFCVEGQLFKVPRHMFVQHSQVFRDMFSIPIPENTEPDGSSDEQPLTLETIEKKDFIQLLRCLYPPKFQRVIGHDFSLDEWKSVLKLANLYEMTEVKDLAVECMTPLLETGSPSLQIHLSQAYNVPKWLQPAKTRLVGRRNPINEDDVMHIGLALALEVCALRENAARENACKIATPSPQKGFGEALHWGLSPETPPPPSGKKKGNWILSASPPSPRLSQGPGFGRPSSPGSPRPSSYSRPSQTKRAPN